MKTTPLGSSRAITWLLVSLACMAATWRAGAQANPNPPERLSYQGFLVDGNGVALATNAPKNYDIIFRVFPAQTGGAVMWAEQQTVTVDKGYFSVLLGEGSTVPGEARPAISTLFAGAEASDRFVETTVKGIGSGGANVTILPRLRLLSSPYSFLSRNAVSAANLVNHTNGQVVNISGAFVGINKASPGSALDVNGTVTAGAFAGGGANLTGLNAGNIASGTLDDARLSANVALLNRNPQNFSGNIGINTTTGPRGNTLQLGNTFHSADGWALQVNHPVYGANIQINRAAGQAGNGLIIDNSANGDANTLLLLCRNNVASNPQNLMWVRGDGQLFAGGLNFTAHPNGGIFAGNDYISYSSVGYHFFNVNGVGKAHIMHNEARFHLPVYGQSFTPTSDRNQKENFVEIDRRELLQKVVNLPLTTWNFKTDKEVRHMGPVSQDFHAAFGLGKDDKGIATVDADGVALAAIQGLHQIVTEKDQEIQKLKRELHELREMVEDLVTRSGNGR